jgi:hypothetical protein
MTAKNLASARENSMNMPVFPVVSMNTIASVVYNAFVDKDLRRSRISGHVT